MMLSYDSIVFDVLKLDDWKKDAEYTEDKTTFLWWHHTITVTCIVNVDATNSASFPKLEREESDDRLFKKKPNAPRRNVKPAGIGQPGYKPRKDIDSSSEEYFSQSTTQGPSKDDIKDFERRAQEFSDRAKEAYEREFGQPPADLERFREAARKEQARWAADFKGKNAPFGGLAGGLGLAALAKSSITKPRLRKNKLRPKITGAQGGSGTIPVTELELRERLRRPRRQLLIWLYTGDGGSREFMLVSPLVPSFETDALHGPICKVLDTAEIHGQMTAVYKLQFETWESPGIRFSYQSTLKAIASQNNGAIVDVARDLLREGSVEAAAFEAGFIAFLAAVQNGEHPVKAVGFAIDDCRLAGLDTDAAGKVIAVGLGLVLGGNAGVAIAGIINNIINKRVIDTPALLSNRWTMKFGWNTQNHLRTQVIEGEALFRMDILKARKLSADQLRSYIWHPIPSGYQRNPPGDDDVEVSPGGEGIKYVIVDQQQMLNFPGGAQFGCIHVEASTDFHYHGYTFGQMPNHVAEDRRMGGNRQPSPEDQRLGGDRTRK